MNNTILEVFIDFADQNLAKVLISKYVRKLKPEASVISGKISTWYCVYYFSFISEQTKRYLQRFSKS